MRVWPDGIEAEESRGCLSLDRRENYIHSHLPTDGFFPLWILQVCSMTNRPFAARAAVCVFCLSATLVLAADASRPGDNWPQWRGPKRDSVSVEKGLLQ